MNELKVYDGVIDQKLLLRCVSSAETSKEYGILHGGGNGSYGFKYNWTLTDGSAPIKQPEFVLLWDAVKIHIKEPVEIHRAYINAHTYGVEDSIHIDESDLEKTITVIVYLCSDWYPEWFGQTMFFKSKDIHNNEIIGSVLPKPNRFIVFDGHIPHCVSPLSRRFSGVRLTCMFKLRCL